MKKLLSISILFFLGITGFAQSGTIKIIIPDILSNKGNIKAALYNDAGSKGFLKDLSSAYRKKECEIKNNSAVIVFKNVPYGKYAVSLFQDENKNNKIDRAAIGFPTEPYGISGNKNTIGPPKFKDGEFELKSSNLTLKIILKSFF